MSKHDIRIALCQISSEVGDIKENKEKIIKYINRAKDQNADVVLFPEMALTGYLPFDLIFYKSFRLAVEEAIKEIVENTNQICAVIGTPTWNNSEQKTFIHNSAVVIDNKTIVTTIDKTLLPNYDVFHEKRYFIPAKKQFLVPIKGINLGIQICEDLWDHLSSHQTKVTSNLAKLGADIILNISASPFSLDKPLDRLEVVKNHVSKIKIPFIYLNSVGANDEITFDGRSFFVDRLCNLSFTMMPFEEDFIIINPFETQDEISENEYQSELWESEATNSILLNLRSYLEKVGFSGKLVLGLSGGIDSAVTAFLASLAVGKDRVTGLIMPSKYSSTDSVHDAQKLVKNLGISCQVVPIQEVVNQYYESLDMNPENFDWTTADENIQARVRANILMYMSNRWNGLVLSTGNKSELAMGYTTLYGDSIGSKNLIGDLYKTQVYELAKYLNTINPSIPESIINKEPTAELRENQKDSDSLPPYPLLDQILELLIDKGFSSFEVVEMGFDVTTVESIVDLVKKNEFKRAQMVQTVKVNEKSFGIGRFVPDSYKFSI